MSQSPAPSRPSATPHRPTLEESLEPPGAAPGGQGTAFFFSYWITCGAIKLAGENEGTSDSELGRKVSAFSFSIAKWKFWLKDMGCMQSTYSKKA